MSGESSCFTKKRYPTEPLAQKVANIKAYERKVKLRVYGCHLCGGYHITSKDKRDFSKETQEEGGR
jgi:hypothetical protein